MGSIAIGVMLMLALLSIGGTLPWYSILIGFSAWCFIFGSIIHSGYKSVKKTGVKHE